jgi:methyl-accepting chemotaxis protein
MKRVEVGIDRTLEAAEEAGRIADAARKGAAESQRGIEAVHDELRAFLAISDESAARVERLAERSRATEDLIDAIEDVHKAIRAMSVNASIEAARAGAGGRGIAVLADDMRRTIAGTAAGIEAGRELLGTMRTEAADAASAARNAAAALRVQIEALTRAREHTREIAGGFGRTHEAVETIVKAGRAQQEDVRTVAIAMRELGTSAGMLTASATHLAEGTRRLSDGQATLGEAVRAAEELTHGTPASTAVATPTRTATAIAKSTATAAAHSPRPSPAASTPAATPTRAAAAGGGHR